MIYGDLVATRSIDGTIRIDRADDLIRISPELLAQADSDVLTLDGNFVTFTASNLVVRYCLEGFDGPNRIARKVEP